jgi:aspartyl-tRNA synthetase
LRAEHATQQVIIMGWVKRRRDFGEMTIFTLQDRSGDVQLTVDANECSAETVALADGIRIGACLGVQGTVTLRTERGGAPNPKMATGDIELLVQQLEVFSRSEPLPFLPEDNVETSDLSRLKYRYLDLRRRPMVSNMVLRSNIARATRDYFYQHDFLEVETPILMKSTPEGARDFLVPSRLEPGKFYALPQSPQIYKQILMMGGLDRYFQVSRCFRDEDLRADRQLEFTQIDFEMSFVTRDSVLEFVEGLFSHILQETMGVELSLPIQRMTYAEALETYGEDKPDLRYDLPLTNVTSIFENSEFGVFQSVAANNGAIKGIKIPGAAFSNSAVKKLEKIVKSRGAGGLARLRWENGEWNTPLSKNLNQEELARLQEAFQPEEGELVLMVAHKDASVTNQSMSTLRRHLAEALELIPEEQTFAFTWITDFPWVEYDEEDGRYYAVSHPFTMPHPEDLHLLDENPAGMRSLSYDLVLNGFELGSGSIRVHDTELQEKLLLTLGFTKEEAQEQFGFLLDALKFGPPPHGGAAFGLDRIAMILAGEESLRDVIAFPKTQSGSCPMSEAPSLVPGEQLEELHLHVIEKESNEKSEDEENVEK